MTFLKDKFIKILDTFTDIITYKQDRELLQKRIEELHQSRTDWCHIADEASRAALKAEAKLAESEMNARIRDESYIEQRDEAPTCSPQSAESPLSQPVSAGAVETQPPMESADKGEPARHTAREVVEAARRECHRYPGYPCGECLSTEIARALALAGVEDGAQP